MELPNGIRRFSYHPFVVKIIKSLNIRTPMRWLYYLLAKQKDNKKRIYFSGIEALFLIDTPLKLRSVETPFREGMGDERAALNKLLNYIEPLDVIYDIGANIGVHTVFMAKKTGPYGKVVAFEPESNTFISFKENVSLNLLNNVIPIQVALGNDFSQRKLYSRGSTGDFSLLDTSKNRFRQNVTIVNGDIFVKQTNLPLPNIVKIDVEGFEYYVIQGLKITFVQEKCRLVFCEIHPTMLPKAVRAEDIISLLKSYGFNKVEAHPRGETLHVFCYKPR